MRRPNDDFDEGGEEQEYIPVAGLNNPRHDESTEGRKKFENLLKAKSTQTRGTPPAPSTPSPSYSTFPYVCRVCRVCVRVRWCVCVWRVACAAFLTRLTVGRAGTRDKMTMNKSSATASPNRRGAGKGKRGKKARNKGSDSADDSDDSESDYCAAEERVRACTPPFRACAAARVSCLCVCGGACAVMCATR
jgi:hypothetical protein